MNIFAAVIAGIASTGALSLLMAMGPRIGMPPMDIVGILGSMFSKEPNRVLGWMMHMIMGIIFALAYAILWSIGIGTPSVLWGIVFGSAHWLVVGTMMGAMPVMHAGIKSGSVSAPGVLMLNNGGMMAFVGGLMGHLVYGIVVAIVYGLFDLDMDDDRARQTNWVGTLRKVPAQFVSIDIERVTQTWFSGR